MSAACGWADLELARRIADAGTLGVALFDRIDGRLTPTAALAGILDRVQAMDENAAVALAAMRRAESELQGLVRVASVGFVLARVLAPAIGALAQSHPGTSLAFLVHADRTKEPHVAATASWIEKTVRLATETA